MSARTEKIAHHKARELAKETKRWHAIAKSTHHYATFAHAIEMRNAAAVEWTHKVDHARVEHKPGQIVRWNREGCGF